VPTNDQHREQADHAIISTTAFPPGARQLAVIDNAIVADPARVVAVVHLLRRHIVQMHVLRIGNEARQEKSEALYQSAVAPCGN
jgi:hypothetical protein